MTGGITLTSRVRITDDVLFRDLQGEMVLLNLKTGFYFGLDPMGARIWQLIREHQDVRKVLDLLLGEYEVTDARCERDLLGFVALLSEKGLIEVCHRADP
ncbi:MAG: PqqD family protein [Candidatus Rokubacteria bacterium]|nr:PqqD family protein [Candidatus Rokubacteria bacterium]